jgi:hypothetical protein
MSRTSTLNVSGSLNLERTQVPETMPRQILISTLCPTCSELCLWYRQGKALFGVCFDHGRVEELHISDLDDHFREEK